MIQKKKHLAVQKLLLIACSLLVGLGLIEILIRTFIHIPTEPWKLNIRSAVERHVVPGNFDYVFETNSLGIRANKEITIPRSRNDNVFRIVMIGDSYVFGYGVADNETIPAALARELSSNRPERDIEVINLGTPNAGPQHYLERIIRYVPKLRPDLVIVGLLPINDTLMSYPPHHYSIKSIENTLRSWVERAEAQNPYPVGGVAGTVLWHSAAVRFLVLSVMKIVKEVDWRTYAVTWPGPRGNVAHSGSPTSAIGPEESCRIMAKATGICGDPESKKFTTTHRAVLKALEDKGVKQSICQKFESGDKVLSCTDVLYYFLGLGAQTHGGLLAPDTKPAVQSQIELTFRTFEIGQRRTSEVGGKFMVAMLPWRPMVRRAINPNPLGKFLIDFGEDPRLITGTRLTDFLAAKCREFSIICFDNLGGFRKAQASSDRPMYFIEGHMTAWGNENYTKDLAKFVASQISQ